MLARLCANLTVALFCLFFKPPRICPIWPGKQAPGEHQRAAHVAGVPVSNPEAIVNSLEEGFVVKSSLALAARTPATPACPFGAPQQSPCGTQGYCTPNCGGYGDLTCRDLGYQ